MSFLTALVVLSSVVREQTQVYGYWCIAQFSMLRCLFLVSQMTLALMTVERYIFICHGIHYLRLIKTGNVHLGMGLVWLVSVTLSFYGAFLLIRGQRGFNRQTTGLVCDAVAIKEHMGFSPEEDLLVFGPPSIIMTLCVMVICYCYACMYCAALRVTMALKCSNRRANRTVSFYLFMFLLQLGPSLLFILLTMMGKRNASIPSCKRLSSIVTPLLIIAPTCVNAAVPLIRNPQIKRALVSVFRQSRRVDGMGRVWQVEGERQVEPAPPPPLPGHAVPSVPEDCR
ncbi:olfactory receptor 10Q1-like [Centroberyx affinis]|uniref:olfactory receptor 10Q1-like n=1 Tax=Centroberyx affinis TaxID=166261 RepID=UPI003A5C0DBC